MKYLKYLECCILAIASLMLVGGCTTSVPAASKQSTSTAATASATPSAPSDAKHVRGVVRTGNLIDVTDVGGASFATPSGNITCDLYAPSADVKADFPAGAVRCDIQKITFTPPPKPASCPLDWGQVLSLVPTAMFRCAGDTNISNARTTSSRVTPWWDNSVDGTATTVEGVSAALPYGKTMIAGYLRCTSAQAGVTCQDAHTHAQFFLSRDRYTLSN